MRNPFRRTRCGSPRSQRLFDRWRKPRGTRFPNGIPRVESDQSPYTLDSVFALRNRMWGETYQAPPPESLKWDLPEDPFDPSDWLDDLDWDDWDEVGKTSHGDPVYIKPLSNGREHG